MESQSKIKPVILAPCANYEQDTVESALEQVLLPLGGLNWVSEGMTVGIKANLVSAMAPDEAATTHPALLCALTRMLRARGARVIIGDSPGGLYTPAFVHRIYDATGMRDTVAAGAELNENFDQTEAVYPEAKVLKTFSYTAWLDECDALIDFCKLKSHGMMGMSAAAKNLFGVIPGTMKPEYHFRFPNTADFSDMLVDINAYFADKVRLCLVDAVQGMEGNGPTKGTPRHIGVLLASPCPHTVDLVCADLIGLGMDAVPTLLAAHDRGLIPQKAEEVDVRIVGNVLAEATVASFAVRDYDHVAVRHSLLFASHGRWISKLLGRLLSSRPQLHASACVGCGKCADICPAHAITIQNRQAVIDRSACIRCFCCQEFCPTGAMRVHRTVIARVLVKGHK